MRLTCFMRAYSLFKYSLSIKTSPDTHWTHTRALICAIKAH